MTETLFTLAWKSLSANAVQKVCQSVLCLFLCQCLQPWANYLAAEGPYLAALDPYLAAMGPYWAGMDPYLADGDH